MSDIKTHSYPENQPSKDRLTVHEVEKLKADKFSEEEIAKKNPTALLMAALCAFVRKTALLLASRPLTGSKNAIVKLLEQELISFKNGLVLLTQQDMSRDSAYALQLSKNWHILIDNINLMEFLDRKKSETVAELKKLVHLFKSYPPGQEHTFGFYMTEYAGKDWLPFPFMELLHHLHEDHLSHPDQSQLSRWIAIIDKTLASL